MHSAARGQLSLAVFQRLGCLVELQVVHLLTNQFIRELAQMLPQVMDKLTPQGQAPAGGLGDIGALLEQLTQR